MSITLMTERVPPHASPRVTARLGGLFWLLTFVTGMFALIIGGRFVAVSDAAPAAANILAHEPQFRLAIAANLLSAACYLAATVFVYELLKPVNNSLSLLAAFFSLVGCAVGTLSGFFQLASLVVLRGEQQVWAFTVEQLHGLVLLLLRGSAQVSTIGFLFFGLHCLLVGGLILRSTFLPRLVGALMVFAGLGWLTFSLANLLSPLLARSLSNFVMLPGMLGEGALTIWLLAAGVNAQRWHEQAAMIPGGAAA